ncbi:TRAP transporter large permease [Acuticoccus sediminis]|uniref:TRAP transporter large permease n=1 Tax=Acuticoccus sediminis TaxID=2184697 RepID=UPI001CFEAB93|nr:TRAP transporter large permease [Acuticoccus sediminis]
MLATVGVLGTALVLGVPVAFALAAAGLSYILLAGEYPSTFAANLFGALNSTTLLSIPFFILAAEILNRSGGTSRLVRMVDAWLGHNKGGLPVVAVVATAFFSAISGSSVATAAAIGSVMIPEMVARGYDKRFAVGLVATAGGLGILIPPSIPVIVYGMVTEQSIGSLFSATLLPGLLLAATLAAVAYVIGRRSGIEPAPKQSMRERLRRTWSAGGVLFLPVLILGGIFSGQFTPTEASAVASIYALGLAVLQYRVPLRDIPQILSNSAAIAGMILLILAGATLFGYALTVERVPYRVFNFIVALQLEPWQLLGLIMIFFIACGMFLEVISVILIAMPILAPILVEMDINLVHFCVLLIINMELAVISPPIGLNLFVVSATSRVPVVEVFKGTLPFALSIVLVLLVLMYVPVAQILTSGLP